MPRTPSAPDRARGLADATAPRPPTAPEGASGANSRSAPTSGPGVQSKGISGLADGLAAMNMSSAKRAAVQEFINDQALLKSDMTHPGDPPARPSDAAPDGDTMSESEPEAEEETIATTRFVHIQNADGHCVLTGRKGEIKRCEDEPITTPGAVQGFGVLMVLEEFEENDKLPVRQVSENATEILGLSPLYLFNLRSFTQLLENDQQDALLDVLDCLPDPETTDYQGPQVFRLWGYTEPRVSAPDEESEPSDTWSCWVAASRPRRPSNWSLVDRETGAPLPPPNWIILEFELVQDTFNPLQFDGSERWTNIGNTPSPESRSSPLRSDGSSGSSTAQPSMFSFVGSPSAAEATSPMEESDDDPDFSYPLEKILESTTSHAKPLRLLRPRGRAPSAAAARRRSRPTSTRTGASLNRPGRNPGNEPLDVFALLNEISGQLNTAADLTTFLNIAVGIIKDVSRFHRVLVYQFDEDMNGKVLNELVNLNWTKDLYKGLVFPATDIPPQARELYKTNKVRFLYDRSQITARMVLRERSDLEYPLDMTHCYLRAMSPIHIQYLANMGIRSSMSVSIIAFGKLWGLIACHSYGICPMRVSFNVRQMLRILSDQISRNVERLEYAKRINSRQAIHSSGLAALAGFEGRDSPMNPEAFNKETVMFNAEDMLSIFDAHCSLLVIKDRCKFMGCNKRPRALLEVAEHFRAAKLDSISHTNNISVEYPDLNLDDEIAGLLYIPLTSETPGQDFMLFFRKGQVHTVNWAGRPYRDEKNRIKATLEPRKSFKLWAEQVRGKSAEWTEGQLESAVMVSMLYNRFIPSWRERQQMSESNHLAALLLSSAPNQLRTPLSQVISTLETALSGNIDTETRSVLENSHEASRALLMHVHDLLELTGTEASNEPSANDQFDLKDNLTETVRPYQFDAQRKSVGFELAFGNLPPVVVGDQRKIRAVVANLVAKAVKHTTVGKVRIDCRNISDSAGDGPPGGEWGAEPGCLPVLITVRDTGRGIPSSRLGSLFVGPEGAGEHPESGDVADRIGLSLASISRLVERLKGQLRVESHVGKGTTFYLTLNLGMSYLQPLSPISSNTTDSDTSTSTIRDFSLLPAGAPALPPAGGS